MSRTFYIVLYRDSNGWQEFENTWEATSSKGAMRAAASATNGSIPSDLMVAVPLRSWQPQPVKVETQQRLRIG